MDRREPPTAGFYVSGGAHALVFAGLVWGFWSPPKLEPPIETVPVEMITTSDLNEIMNGEKNAKQMPVSQRRVDKVAELEDHKDAPPTPNAAKDTPPEPTPDKLVVDPGQAEPKPLEPTPPAPVAAVPPPPAASAPPPPPAPVPPERPVEKVETPPPTPPVPPERPLEKAEAPPPEDKPPPLDAEPVMPPPRPKVEPPKEPVKHAEVKPKKEAKRPVPKPPSRPVKLAKLEPTPAPPPAPLPQPKPEPKLLDRVSSLLDRMKPDKPLDKVASLLDHLRPDPPKPEPRPVARIEPPKPEPPKAVPVERPRSGNEVKEAKPRDDFSPDKIAAMLSHEAPQRKASTGRSLAQVASLGSPTAHAEHMSPSVAAQLDGWLIDHYRGCWSYFGLGGTQDYVPTVRIHMAQDGSLIGEPSIINPPHDPNLKSLADSALRAVNKCNPLPIPERFRPYYDQGYRQRVVRFDPKEMS